MKEPKIRFKGFDGKWENFTLKDICEINPKSTLPNVFEYVDLESVVGTEMIFHRTERKGSAPSRAQRLAQKGDIFYQTVRPYQKNNYLFDKDDINYVFSTGYAQLRTKIDSGYLFTLMQSSPFVNKVLLECTGTSYPAINPTNLSKIKVYIVDNKNIQRNIADYFQYLDSFIQSTTKKIESLKQVKAASLQSMFPQEGETKPRVRFKGFEGDWEKVSLNDILEERNEKSRKTLEYPLMAFIAYKGVAPKGERYDRSALVNDIENKIYKRTEYGDFIYSSNNLETGSIGLNSYGKATISPVYSIFRCKDMIDFNFIGRRLICRDIINEMIKWRQGVVYGQWRIHEKDFLTINVLLPSYQEQTKIGDYFSNLDSQITLQTQRLEKLKQIKSACLDNMFV